MAISWNYRSEIIFFITFYVRINHFLIASFCCFYLGWIWKNTSFWPETEGSLFIDGARHSTETGIARYNVIHFYAICMERQIGLNCWFSGIRNWFSPLGNQFLIPESLFLILENEFLISENVWISDIKKKDFLVSENVWISDIRNYFLISEKTTIFWYQNYFFWYQKWSLISENQH